MTVAKINIEFTVDLDNNTNQIFQNKCFTQFLQELEKATTNHTTRIIDYCVDFNSFKIKEADYGKSL